MLKAFPVASLHQNEIYNVIEARNRGSKNDSTNDFIKALHPVNGEKPVSLKVKINEDHED